MDQYLQALSYVAWFVGTVMLLFGLYWAGQYLRILAMRGWELLPEHVQQILRFGFQMAVVATEQVKERMGFTPEQALEYAITSATEYIQSQGVSVPDGVIRDGVETYYHLMKRGDFPELIPAAESLEVTEDAS